MPNTPQQEQAFDSFDWSSPEWQHYLSNLHPTPPEKLIIKYKRRFYRNVIDSSFSAEEPPHRANSSGSSKPAPSSTPTGQPQRQYPVLRAISLILLSVTVLLGVATFIPFLPLNLQTPAIITFVAAAAVETVVSYGKPRFNAEYWHKVATSELCQSLLFTTSTANVGPGKLTLVSPILTSLLLLAQREHLLPKGVSQHPTVNQAFSFINSNRYYLMQLRADLEVMVGIVLTIFSLFNLRNLFFIILFWNLLRFKYMTDGFIQTSFSKINERLLVVFGHPSCPTLIRTLYVKIKNFAFSFVDPEVILRRQGQGT